MSIVIKEKDNWDTRIASNFTGMYFYIFDSHLNIDTNSEIIGFAPTITSMCFNPFMSSDDIELEIIQTNFDVAHFGSPVKGIIPNVFRLNLNSSYIQRKLADIEVLPEKPPTIGGERNWKNESKLYFEPYTHYILDDYFNSPLKINPQDLYHQEGKSSVNVLMTISDRNSYNLYVEGLKGDSIGNLEGIVNTSSLDLPVMSSSYSQFLATSKSVEKQTIANQINLGNANYIANASQSFLNTSMNLNPLAAISSSANMVAQGYLQNKNNQSAISMAVANRFDLSSAPRTSVSQGSDASFSICNSRRSIDLIKMEQQNEYYKQQGDYFALYGYKQNKINKIDIRNRYYYNYIKTQGINIDSHGIPKHHLTLLKNIYDKGTTVWHIDRQNVKVFDYSKDNYEI